LIQQHMRSGRINSTNRPNHVFRNKVARTTSIFSGSSLC